MGEAQIEKLYQIIVGVTIAFLTVAFSSFDSGFRPNHALWLLTVYIITRDWWDSTGYEYFEESQILVFINVLYMLCLLMLPIFLRLIESNQIHVFSYPLIIVIFTLFDFIYLWQCYKLIQKEDKKKLLDFGMNIGWDILAIVIYILIVIYSWVNISNGIDWKLVTILIIAIVVIEDLLGGLLIKRFGNWITDNFLVSSISK